jgi:hypothetical protein
MSKIAEVAPSDGLSRRRRRWRIPFGFAAGFQVSDNRIVARAMQ